MYRHPLWISCMKSDWCGREQCNDVMREDEHENECVECVRIKKQKNKQRKYYLNIRERTK